MYIVFVLITSPPNRKIWKSPHHKYLDKIIIYHKKHWFLFLQIVAERDSPPHKANVRGRVGRVRWRGAGAGGAERRGAGVRGRHVLAVRGRRAAAAWRCCTYRAVHFATGLGMLYSILLH